MTNIWWVLDIRPKTFADEYWLVNKCEDSSFLLSQEQQQAILDSSQFLNEINHFKIRLDTLEKERFELEEKVRRLQVGDDTSHSLARQKRIRI